MFFMMKAHQFVLVLLCWLYANRQVDAYIYDANSTFEDLFTTCVNGSSEVFSCINRCGPSVAYFLNCQCDPACLSHGDCCLDYEHLCIALTGPHHMARVVSSFAVPDETELPPFESHEDEDRTATPSEDASENTDEFLIPQHIIHAAYPEFDLESRNADKHLHARGCVEMGYRRYFKLVRKCMDSAFYGSQLEQLCLATPSYDILTSLPVAVANDTHYKNIYCAFCSGIQYKDIYFWKLAFHCGHDVSDISLEQGKLFDAVGIMMKLCDYDILPVICPGTQLPRSCLQPHPSDNRCKSRNGSAQNKDQQLCDTYSYPVTVNANWYKNVHCAFCNGEFQNGSSNISCSYDNEILQVNKRPLSLPMLFSFSAKDGALLSHLANEVSSNTSQCNINEWFDPFLQECRAIYCPSNTYIIDGVCVKDLNVSSLNFDQCSANSSFWKQKYENRLEGTDMDPQRRSWITVRAVSNHQSALNLIIVTFRVSLKSEKLDVNIKTLKTVTASALNKTIQTHTLVFELRLTGNTTNFPNMPSAIRRTILLLSYDSEITMSVQSVEWQNYESLSTYTDMCTEAHGNVFFRVMWAKDTTHFSDGQYDELLRHEDMFNEYQPKKLTILSNNDNKEWSSFDFKCCSSPLMCRKIVFNSSEFDWDSGNNGSLLHKASGIIIPADMFSLVGNGHVLVCDFIFDQNVADKTKEYFLDIQTYVTIVGNIVSIISLFATLFTMITFPELQNLPGKIISRLSISLLLANVFLLTCYPSSSQWLCLCFGLSLHYSWLSVFFWTNALAIDLTRTFHVNSKRMVFRIKGNVQFIFYSIYAWLSPAIIVSIGILIHFLSERRIYDTMGTCWLFAGQPIITLFLIPFTFVMIVNTALYIVILFSISKTREGMDRVTESSINCQSRALFWLAIKLSFTLGITWSLGLIAAMVNNEIVWYIFNVVTSLSGLGVSLSINANQKVFRLWQSKLKCRGGLEVEGAKEKKGSNVEVAASDHECGKSIRSQNSKKDPNDSEI